MPAVHLARLKIQVAGLMEKFGEPEAFVSALREILDGYADHSRRAEQTARHLSLPTSYTPSPVLRYIKRELERFADARPAEALALTDALWKARSLESRLLAAHLLGCIPPVQALSLLSRLPEWLRFSSDRQIRRALLTEGLARVRKENPAALLLLLEEWLRLPNPRLQAWSLEALIPLLEDERFEDLPTVFRILRPAIRSVSPSTQVELQNCLVALGRVSEIETAALLRECLADPISPSTVRLLRRMLPAFSPKLQSVLRDLLRPKEEE